MIKKNRSYILNDEAIFFGALLMSYILMFLVQDHTKVGSADSQDIQLCGMGIQAEHCVIDITTDVAVILTPHPNAR